MKILCFGDSNTYGYDPCPPFGGRYPLESCWTSRLAKLSGWDVINAGQNGREIPSQEREWMQFDLIYRNNSPLDLLMVMLGGNDLMQGLSVSATTERMESFLKRIDIPAEQILLVTPPPMQPGTWSNDVLMTASRELIPAYESLAKQLGTQFVNTAYWQIPVTFDGDHFTEEGHSLFAEKLFSCIQSFSSQKP